MKTMMKKRFITLTSLVCALAFFLGTTSAYANTSVNVYLTPGTHGIYSDERWYTYPEDDVLFKVWGNTGTVKAYVVRVIDEYTVSNPIEGKVITVGPGEVRSATVTIPQDGYYSLYLKCENGTSCRASGSMDDIGN